MLRRFQRTSDKSDLWAPPVRKWMTEWHSPVDGMFDKPRTFRGSGHPNVNVFPAQTPRLDFSVPFVTFPGYSDTQYLPVLM